MGRHKKPVALKKLHGTYRPDRDEVIPMPQISIPECPKFLKKVAKKEWKRVTKLLFNNGMISELDLAIVAAYCDTYANWVYATREVAKSGLLRKTQSGHPFPTPWYAVQKKERDIMLKFAKELGLSPIRRGKVTVEKPEEEDPNAHFFE